MSSNHQSEPVGDENQPAANHQPKLTGLEKTMASPGAKFILIGFITMALLIPAMMVWGLVEDRAQRARQVAHEISQGWGGRQVVNGPYLVVPYTVTRGEGDNAKSYIDHMIVSPEELEITSAVDVQERRKSIYKTHLYHTSSTFRGTFSPLKLEQMAARGGQAKLEEAFLVMSVSDPTGFRSDFNIKIGQGKREKFLSGFNELFHMGQTGKNSQSRAKRGGVHLKLSRGRAVSGFDFEISMALNGSQNLSFMPSGRTTKLNLKSNWAHPGFSGRFLPETRDISDEGFSAAWTVPNLARGMDDVVFGSVLPFSETVLSVSFVEPLKFYQVTSRTLKYSIAFFSLVFLAIFVLELLGHNAIHWIQYTLSGLAMVVFYVLLLALAEQIGFGYAYLISSLATTGLISWYIGDTLASRSGTYTIGSVLGLTYLIMYLILNEEQYALLAGSTIAFLAIAVTMVATRRVNWSNSRREPQVAG